MLMNAQEIAKQKKDQREFFKFHIIKKNLEKKLGTILIFRLKTYK